MRAHAPTGWNLHDVESMADWAEELRAVPSSTVSRYRKTLTECSARLASLTQASPELGIEVTPPRKSSRVSKKVPIDTPEASAATSVPLTSGTVYINTEKVRFFFCSFYLLDIVVVRSLYPKEPSLRAIG